MLPCSKAAIHLARTQQQHRTSQGNTEVMRGPGHMASPLLLLLLLVRNAGAHRATVCESDYLRVWSTQLGGAAPTIAGCYERNSYYVAHDKPVYTKTDGAVGGTTYGVLSSQVSDSAHGAPQWVIARIHQHDPSMEVLAGTDGVVEAEVEDLVCTSGEDWRTAGSPSGVQDWKCQIRGNGSLRSAEDVSVLVRCGCSAVDREGGTAFDRVVGGGGGGSGGGGSARLNAQGVDRTANLRSRRRADAVAATDGSTSSSNGDTTSSSGNDFSGFWSWIIISGCVIGLIVLCCVGWYIRNPWCKSAPLGDPNASAEDAAPQAPKTSFQPWGASQPPK